MPPKPKPTDADVCNLHYYYDANMLKTVTSNYFRYMKKSTDQINKMEGLALVCMAILIAIVAILVRFPPNEKETICFPSLLIIIMIAIISRLYFYICDLHQLVEDYIEENLRKPNAGLRSENMLEQLHQNRKTITVLYLKELASNYKANKKWIKSSMITLAIVSFIVFVDITVLIGTFYIPVFLFVIAALLSAWGIKIISKSTRFSLPPEIQMTETGHQLSLTDGGQSGISFGGATYAGPIITDVT